MTLKVFPLLGELELDAQVLHAPVALDAITRPTEQLEVL